MFSTVRIDVVNTFGPPVLAAFLVVIVWYYVVPTGLSATYSALAMIGPEQRDHLARRISTRSGMPRGAG